MAVEPLRLREIRDLVLAYVYQHGAGKPYFSVEDDRIRRDLSLSREEFQAVSVLMHSQSLSHVAFVGSMGLSVRGQDEAEALGPEVLMRSRAPATTVHINASYSVVQVGAAGSSQSASLSVQHSHLVGLLADIERALPALSMDDATREEAKGLVASMRKGIGTIGEAGLKAIGAALGSTLVQSGSDLGHRLLKLLGITLG